MTRRYRSTLLPAPGDTVTLDQETSHHVLKVCRHPRGDELLLFDGAGSEIRCRLEGVEGGLAVVLGVGLLPRATPLARLVLLQATCRQQTFETVLRMGTELGVTWIVPVLTSRAVARPARSHRWDRVVVAAARQCGRTELPEVLPPMPLTHALELELPAVRLVAVPGAPILAGAGGDKAILLGPEGGLSPDEVAEARAVGFVEVGLGPLVLRVDTAAAAALARHGHPAEGSVGGDDR